MKAHKARQHSPFPIIKRITDSKFHFLNDLAASKPNFNDKIYKIICGYLNANDVESFKGLLSAISEKYKDFDYSKVTGRKERNILYMPELYDQENYEALEFIFSEGLHEKIGINKKAGSFKYTPLMERVTDMSFDAMQLLLKNGADPTINAYCNTSQVQGDQPLVSIFHRVLTWGPDKAKKIRALNSLSIDPNQIALDKPGTPLMMAISKPHEYDVGDNFENVMALLQNEKIDVDLKCQYGYSNSISASVLGFLCSDHEEYGYCTLQGENEVLEMVQLFIGKGASIRSVSRDDDTGQEYSLEQHMDRHLKNNSLKQKIKEAVKAAEETKHSPEVLAIKDMVKRGDSQSIRMLRQLSLPRYLLIHLPPEEKTNTVDELAVLSLTNLIKRDDSRAFRWLDQFPLPQSLDFKRRVGTAINKHKRIHSGENQSFRASRIPPTPGWSIELDNNLPEKPTDQGVVVG